MRYPVSYIGVTYVVPGRCQRPYAAVAALDSKADLGLAPPNPLVRILATDVWAGGRLGSRSLKRILCLGQGDSPPPVCLKRAPFHTSDCLLIIRPENVRRLQSDSMKEFEKSI